MKNIVILIGLLIGFVTSKTYCGDVPYYADAEAYFNDDYSKYVELRQAYVVAGLDNQDAHILAENYVFGGGESLLSTPCTYYEIIIWKCRAALFKVCDINEPPLAPCSFDSLIDIEIDYCYRMQYQEATRLLISEECYLELFGPESEWQLYCYVNPCDENEALYVRICCDDVCSLVQMDSITGYSTNNPAICDRVVDCENETVVCLKNAYCSSKHCIPYADFGGGVKYPKELSCSQIDIVNCTPITPALGITITVTPTLTVIGNDQEYSDWVKQQIGMPTDFSINGCQSLVYPPEYNVTVCSPNMDITPCYGIFSDAIEYYFDATFKGLSAAEWQSLCPQE
jgi:hypothetical protein